jgi:hypothetical protein
LPLEPGKDLRFPEPPVFAKTEARKTLAAKAGLTQDEIVGAYAKRGTKIANDLLIVHKDSAYPTFWCGSNPHFAVSVVDETGKITPNRTFS